jgi:ABC-2 type transport system permease protein
MRLLGIRVIAKREYLSRIRSKGFWISTIALPVLMATWMIVPGLVMTKTRSSQRLALVDLTGSVARPLTRELEELSARTAEQFDFDVVIVDSDGTPGELRQSLDEQVLAGEIQAWIWIDSEGLDENRIEYHAESVSNFITRQVLERALSSVVRRVRLEEAGYDSQLIGELSRSIDLHTTRISKEGSRAEGGFGGFALAIGLFTILYMTTLIYGQQVMLGVLEEKNSRVVEVIVSSVKPAELMLGKLVGICLIGLTQLGIWVSTALVATAPAVVGLLAWMPEGLEIPTVSPMLVVHFLALFLLGFFFYATLYATIGSAFNNPQEAQQLASIAVIFVILPWVFFMPVLNDPDSTLAVVTSLIPVFTPFLMMLRIAVKSPPAWQILLGYLLTATLCLAMVWLAARIYRIGILMYGKKPTLKELWRWLRYA